MKRILVISGPTGSGKSALGLKIAKELKGEIVNADSVQVYRDFNIGAAKPSKEEFSLIKHHLYSFVPPTEQFTAWKYRESAVEKIESLYSRDTTPIFVGGSGLYIRALISGLTIKRENSPQTLKAFDEIKNSISKENFDPQIHAQELHKILSRLDPISAGKIYPNDFLRIKNALLFFLENSSSIVTSFESIEKFQAENSKQISAIVFVFIPQRENLYQKINKRVDDMFSQGLIDEVNELHKEYGALAPAFSAIGYAQCLKYILGKQNLERTIEEIKTSTRRFAKRQITWWRHQPKLLGWQMMPMQDFKPEESDLYVDYIKEKWLEIGSLEEKEEKTTLVYSNLYSNLPAT